MGQRGKKAAKRRRIAGQEEEKGRGNSSSVKRHKAPSGKLKIENKELKIRFAKKSKKI